MARYDHLPTYKAAYDLALHMEKIVRSFSRYHKYTLGAEPRDFSRNILKRIIAANNTGDTGKRIRILEELRGEAEWFKVLVRIYHESGGFANTKAYLHVSEQAVTIAKQNEGWLRQSGKKRDAAAARKKENRKKARTRRREIPSGARPFRARRAMQKKPLRSIFALRGEALQKTALLNFCTPEGIILLCIFI